MEIETIGFIAGFIGLFAWVPQLTTTWRHNLHEGIDLRTLYIISLALSIWCVYGFLKEAWAVCFSNLSSGFIVSLIIYKVKKLRKYG
ncbi:MAG: hypothetical protein EBY39_07085 [Flavobacteriia bacterium]|nr:hypothetical protein [Flavobacteriia bacterium]